MSRLSVRVRVESLRPGDTILPYYVVRSVSVEGDAVRFATTPPGPLKGEFVGTYFWVRRGRLGAIDDLTRVLRELQHLGSPVDQTS